MANKHRLLISAPRTPPCGARPMRGSRKVARQHFLGRRQGVSLVEALVALAVMAFGMLSMVGVQGTMRLNSDTAKQRTEAMRIASEDIERLRAFATLAPQAGQANLSYNEIASRTVEAYAPPDAIGNASYRVVRTVSLVPGVRQKVVTVQVSWLDRSNTQQTVTLDSAISGTDPSLGGLLALQVSGTASNQRNGRHVSIPVGAVDIDGGRSRFEPPGAVDLAWYFNNMSGVMEVCNAAGGGCVPATLVSGSVAYHLADAQPSGADAENPQGPALNLAAGPSALALASPVDAGSMARCYANPVQAGQHAIDYFCAVIAATASGWGGQLNPRPVDGAGALVAFSNDASNYRSCRYTADLASDTDLTAAFTLNADHPKTYCMEVPGVATANAPCTGKRVTGNLINQNFLVIRGNRSCPADDASTPLISGNTQSHQP